METKQVFVIWTNPIFHDSVRRLLQHPHIEWVGAAQDYDVARDEILYLRPGTILVEEPKVTVPGEALEIMEACPWNVRLVGLNLTDNQSTIYHRKQELVGETEDLLRLILET